LAKAGNPVSTSGDNTLATHTGNLGVSHIAETDANLSGNRIIGLIGSEVSAYFHERDFVVHGVDNNQRKSSSARRATPLERAALQKALSRFTHHELDIRDRPGVLQLIETSNLRHHPYRRAAVP